VPRRRVVAGQRLQVVGLREDIVHQAPHGMLLVVALLNHNGKIFAQDVFDAVKSTMSAFTVCGQHIVRHLSIQTWLNLYSRM